MRKYEHILWGLTYILLIPSFALVYHYYLPYEFFHSTSQFEKSTLTSEADDIAKNLKYEMFGDKNTIDTTVNKLVISFQDISISNFKTTDSTIDFYLNYNFINNSISTNYNIHQKCSIDKTVCCRNFGEIEPYYLRNFYIESKKSYIPINIDYWFLNTSHRKSIDFKGEKTINIPEKLNEDLIYFANALDGFPSKTTGNFYRMLYFSTITITTVGFGDIVPLTTRARLLVGLEAFLGVLTIGLFLNSLANKISKKDTL